MGFFGNTAPRREGRMDWSTPSPPYPRRYTQVVDSIGETRRPSRSLRVLFVYSTDATFVRTDMSLLQRLCNVTPFKFQGKRSYPSLAAKLLSADIVCSWFAVGFAAVASGLGRLVGTRSIVISGGWDVTNMPEISYGLLTSDWAILRARLALSSANLVLAFSEWSANEIRKIAPTSRVRCAYLGVDTNRFRPGTKENIVLCVANVNRENLVRKGLRSFVRAAAYVPGARFVLVGKHLDDGIAELRTAAGNTVEFTGWVPDESLRDLLARAKVYVQPSYTEGFGMAIAEAMSSGCVPVVTNRGAIPEVVGDSGVYVEYGDDLGLAKAIQRALSSDLGEPARRRIERLFSLDNRLSELRRALCEVATAENGALAPEPRGPP